MAFLGKVGNMLRQTVTKQVAVESSALRPSIYQAIRCMSTKLFIGGVNYQTDNESLREAFSKYGEVIEARIIVDRDTGRSRGFGFVTYSNSEEASSAIQALDGKELHGRSIRVNYATDRARSNFGGGGYGGGGYGSGGYGSGGYGGGGGGYSGGGGGGYNTNYNSGGGYGGSGNYAGGYGGGDSGGNNSWASSDMSSSGNNSWASSDVSSGNFPSNFASGNSFDGGVAGGGGGSDNFGSSSGLGDTGSNQFDFNESSSMGTSGDIEAQPLEENDRDEDDTGDFAKRA